jgi:DNA-binding transcriptional LysR family regulator
MNTFDLDWTLCRSLLAILRESSLSGAARTLGVAHPTIRRHLEDIEAHFGAALFTRSPTGLVPTDIGQQLRAPAEAMEAAFEQLLRAGSAPATSIAGTVRITASEIVGAEVLPFMLQTLRNKYPGLVVELHLTDKVEDVLRSDADIAIRMTEPTQSDVIARKIGDVGLGLFAHRDWLARHKQTPTLANLIASKAMIGYDRERLIIESFGAQGVTVSRGDFGFRSDSTLAQLAALRAGHGVGICHLALGKREPELVHVLPDMSAHLGMWLVSHPNLKTVARIRTVLDHLHTSLTTYTKV